MRLEEIDKQNLDEILQTHAYEFQAATEDLPELKRLMSEKKLEIERTESFLYLEYRKQFESIGDKITEGKLSASVKSDSAYTDAYSDWLSARKAYDAVDQLREVYMQRESSIKMLVALYQSQYWSLGGLTAFPQASKDSEGSRFKKR